MILIYVTYPSEEEARAISRDLLEARLVACANIMAAHRALYHWDGAVQESSEFPVLYKTRKGALEAVRGKIMERHSYEVPCIIEIPVTAGHPEFLKWVEGETGGVSSFGVS